IANGPAQDLVVAAKAALFLWRVAAVSRSWARATAAETACRAVVLAARGVWTSLAREFASSIQSRIRHPAIQSGRRARIVVCRLRRRGTVRASKSSDGARVARQ